MNKVILLDSSGSAYGAGLAEGLSRYIELFYVTRETRFTKGIVNVTRYNWFFSGEKQGKIYKVIKGLCYVNAFIKTIALIKRKNIDVVHIQWLSLPVIDNVLLSMIKKTGVTLVFTAHNVLPHRDSETYLDCYRKHYQLSDRIIIHGEEIKKEFLGYFSEYSDKLVIERHGSFSSLSTEISIDSVDSELLRKIKNAKKVAIFFGNMFYNKGVDALIRHWIINYSNTSELILIVVGKKDVSYNELNNLEGNIQQTDNLFYKPQIIEEVELNTYISLSDIVVMPYRHASMSGIVFKAAAMNTTVLTTDTGSIHEYVSPECGFLVPNIDSFFDKFDELMESDNRKLLREMGYELCSFIDERYGWDSIAADTIKNVYRFGERS